MKRIILLLLISTLFYACSDAAKIKRKLHFGGGKWEIIEYKRYFWSPVGLNGQNIFLCANCGTIEFKRDGSGSLSISDPESSGSSQFTYTNSKDIVTLFIDGEGAVYDLTWNIKKTQMTLSQNIGHAGFVNVIVCKKK